MKNTSNKKSIFDKMIPFAMFIFFALFFTAIGFLVFYSRSEKSLRDSGYDITYIEDWTVIDSAGKEFKVKGPYNDDRMHTEDFVTVSTIPENVDDNSILCFVVSNSYKVYIDGKLRQKFDNPGDVLLPGGAVKSFYTQIPLTSEDKGKELKITRFSTPRRPMVVSETFVSDSSGIYNLLMNRFGVTFIFSFILFVVAIVVLTIGMIIRVLYRIRIEMLYASLAIMVISAWMLTNSFLFPIVFGHYHIDGIVNYMFCLLIPFGLLVYLDSIQDARYRAFTGALLCFSGINALFWSFLHFTSVFPFPRALIFIDIILAVELLCVFVLLVVDIKRGFVLEYKYTAIGFAGFLIFCAVEIVVLIFALMVDDGIPMLIGLVWLLAFVVVQQIEDLRKINDEKQNALALSDAKTDFLASMSHEIRTPINSILGMNEMILRENHDDTIDEYARTIANSGKMLLSIVNDVLDFSKIESGKLEISCANYSFSSVLRDVNGIIKERADGKGLQYEVIVDNYVPDGHYSDEFRIKQIMINLLTNAVKYTDKGKVSLHVSGKFTSNAQAEEIFLLEIIVSDTGRGIKDVDQQGLFDAFSRADMKKNRNIEGTGLGLAIVKRILDSLNGQIRVESEYGKGSSFIANLPVKVIDHSPVINGTVQKKMTVSEKKEVKKKESDYLAPDAKILVVDDNAVNLNIVKLFLKRNRIAPELCSSGKEAVEKCFNTKYDLLLLDHMMPAPDGIETLKLIRNSEESLNKETTAIMLTANALAGSRQIYIDAGFDDYLSKPIDSGKLEKMVFDHLPKELIVKNNSNE